MKRTVLLALFLFGYSVTTLFASTLFEDNFDTGPKADWGNERGDWFVNDGAYQSTQPNNWPATLSSITSYPNLEDFIVEVDIYNVNNGGLFLRTVPETGQSHISQGIALVVDAGSYLDNPIIYWHVLSSGSVWGPRLNIVELPDIISGDDIHLRIIVEGDNFLAFVNSSSAPTTSLTSNAYSSGSVALYDFDSNQSFDNFELKEVIPEPSSMILLVLGVFGSIIRKIRK